MSLTVADSLNSSAESSALPANIQLVWHDLPADACFDDGLVAIDTETDGLDVRNNRLWLCQVGDSRGNVWLIKFDGQNYAAPNLRAVLENPRLVKLFHYGRFDIAMLRRHLGLGDISPVFCTKIASKLVRTDETKHNLRTLVRRYCGVELDKSEQLSNWALPELSASQQAYAASDVLYLAKLWEALMDELAAKDLNAIMDQALRFLSARVEMDLRGYPEDDLFAHH